MTVTINWRVAVAVAATLVALSYALTLVPGGERLLPVRNVYIGI